MRNTAGHRGLQGQFGQHDPHTAERRPVPDPAWPHRPEQWWPTLFRPRDRLPAAQHQPPGSAAARHSNLDESEAVPVPEGETVGCISEYRRMRHDTFADDERTILGKVRAAQSGEGVAVVIDVDDLREVGTRKQHVG